MLCKGFPVAAFVSECFKSQSWLFEENAEGCIFCHDAEFVFVSEQGMEGVKPPLLLARDVALS